MLQRQTSRMVVAFAKKNSGALIIGVSLIVGLNFGRFADWATELKDAVRSAVYHISGQADADQKAQQRHYENLREQQQQQAARGEAERAERTAKYEREEAALRELTDAWQSYLAANRTKVKQVEVIRDDKIGDYPCLRILFGEPSFKPLLDESEKKAREQKTPLWTYDLRDRIADGFVQWLNSNTLLDKTNWKYDDLPALPLHNKIFSDCLIPNQVWRANRYQKRID